MPRYRSEEPDFEELSSYSSEKEMKKHRKSRRRLKAVLMSVAAVFCMLLILLGSGMIYISTGFVSELSTTAITKDPEELGITSHALEMQKKAKGTTNIALFGVDSRYNNFVGQSDVIMILTIDNDHNKVKMTSIMRDSQVNIEGQSNSGYVNWNTKINAAYALGGPELAIRTINRNFDIYIEDYVTVNFRNMAKLIDAFGGIDLEITSGEIQHINTNMYNLTNETYNMTGGSAGILDSDYMYDNGPGVYHLNGNQAVSYGRIRYLDSDFVRVQRQQKVLRKLMEKAVETPKSEYYSVLSELMPLCETSLDITDVLNFAPIIAAGFTVETISVPDANYESISDIDYNLVYSTEAAAHRISSFIYEENSPYWEDYGYDTGVSAAQ